MRVITLMTDFGSKNGFAGVLKGVIWKIAPDVQIADITHEIAPQNIMEGAIALWRAAPYFPDGTIHVAVVDPGVGTTRRPMAARIADQYFVGPDNGVFTPLLEQAEQTSQPISLIHMNKPQYWLPEVSSTFHGRDIFSPAAAHLANGVALTDLGEPFTDPVRLSLAQPVRIPGGWRGQVILIDIFGNIATNLRADLVKDHAACQIQLAGHVVQGLVTTYGERKPGDLVALVDSENFIEVAVVNGNGAQKLGIVVGEPVEITLRE